MTDEPTQSPLLPEKYETICREIRRRMPSYCRWTWDDRFHVALIVIDQKDVEAVFSAVINCFVQQWDYRTIAEASVKVRNLLASLFEVKPGQVVFTSDEGVDSVLLAAW